MANPIVHWEFSTPDPAKAAEFYGQLFDWKIDHQPEMSYWMAATGEGGIGGGLMKTPEGAPHGTTVYVLVDDLNAYLAKAESLGGGTIVPPTPIPGHGAFALLRDPTGTVVGIYTAASE